MPTRAKLVPARQRRKTNPKPVPKPSKPAPSPSYDHKATAITPIEYGGLQTAFDFFNVELFGGTLPDDCLITYMRKPGMFGHFAPARYSERTGDRDHDEIALNPDMFIGRSDEEILSTVAHEMVHVWQHYHGKPASHGYHNKEWAAKMKVVGLQPTNTGGVGGKETGARMLDYIIPNGAFTKTFAQLAATGWKLNLQSAHRPGPEGRKDPSKTKFVCTCGRSVRGKPDTLVACVRCIGLPEHLAMKAEGALDRTAEAA